MADSLLFVPESSPLSEPQSSSDSLASEVPSIASSEAEASGYELVDGTRKRKATSAVWKYFRDPRDTEQKRRDGYRVYYCPRCPGKPKPYTVSTNAKKHLLSEHGIDVDALENPKAGKRQQTLHEAIQRGALEGKLNHSTFREAQLRLIATRRLPFNTVTWPEYKDLLILLNPRISSMLTLSPATVATDLERSFAVHKATIRDKLSKARSKLHFGIDLWTSTHRKAYMSITGQYVDEAFILRTILLGLPRIIHDHTGENMANLLFSTLKGLDVIHNLGFCVADNHGANDKCLRFLSVKLKHENISFDPVHQRIRCIGHIINLAVQSFLFATNKKAMEEALAWAWERDDEDEVEGFSDRLHAHLLEAQDPSLPVSFRREAGWRSTGTLGKVHNLAVFIRSSPQISDAWGELAHESLGIDNETRWNSWFYLLEKVQKHQGHLFTFCREYSSNQTVKANTLTDDDWDVIAETVRFLSFFKRATLDNEGAFVSLDRALVTLDAVMTFCEREVEKPSYPRKFQNSVNMCWLVLKKYYGLTDKSPINAAALLLHPARRLAYLQKNWNKSWVKPAIAKVRQMWEEYRDLPAIIHTTQNAANPPQRDMDQYDDIMASMSVCDSDIPQQGDEFDAFINSQPYQIPCSALEWWCQDVQRRSYPHLARMAINVLSAPSSADENERVFSGSRRTISWERASISPEHVGMSECMVSWQRTGLISSIFVAGDDGEGAGAPQSSRDASCDTDC